jgi:hypothetical protein
MRGLTVVLAVALSAPAFASEGRAPDPGGEVTVTVQAAQAEATSAQPVPAATEVGEPDDRDSAPAPFSRQPRLRWVELAVELARARHPGRQVDLFAPMAPPLVVADGFGLLVQRRFGR